MAAAAGRAPLERFAELLGVDERPHRAVVDLQTTLGEFIHKPAQGEIYALDPLQQPHPVLARNRFRLVAPILPGLTLDMATFLQ
jgi:hypothetical protein